MPNGATVHLWLDMANVNSLGTELQQVEHLRMRLEDSAGRLVLMNLNAVQFALLHLFGCLHHYLPHNYTMATNEWKDAGWDETGAENAGFRRPQPCTSSRDFDEFGVLRPIREGMLGSPETNGDLASVSLGSQV